MVAANSGTDNQAIEECKLAGPRDRGGLQLCDGHSLTRTAWPAEPRCAEVFSPFFSTCGKALLGMMGKDPVAIQVKAFAVKCSTALSDSGH